MIIKFEKGGIKMLVSKKKSLKLLGLVMVSVLALSTFSFAAEGNNNLNSQGGGFVNEQSLNESGRTLTQSTKSMKATKDSGWMYTGNTEKYLLKDDYVVYGYFSSGARYRADYNQNITDWDEYGSYAEPDASFMWADVRVIGSYKLNNSTARLTILGEAGHVQVGGYASLIHVYFLHGDGSYDMDEYA